MTHFFILTRQALIRKPRKNEFSPTIYLFLRRMTRMAFATASSVTPTSEKTASHMVAIPNAPRMRKIAFTPKAKPMFCHTIRRVRFAIESLLLFLTADLSSARCLRLLPRRLSQGLPSQPLYLRVQAPAYH